MKSQQASTISSVRDRSTFSKTIITNTLSKLKPSEMLSQCIIDVSVNEYPKIIEFLNIQDNSSQVHCAVDVDRPIFWPSPSVLVFEDYTPFAIHEKKIFFRNNDKVARRLQIIPPETPFFEVSAPRSINGHSLNQSKIAAGMEIYFIVKFKPEEVRDYGVELVCCTEREKFLYPVRAIGERPRMSFPDEILFGKCPVKSTSRKMILAQNIGSSLAKFRLCSLSTVFTCTSETIVVEPGASHPIEIFFSPSTAEQFESEIEIEYSKSIRCFVKVCGYGTNVDVSLSTPSLTLEPSFISLSSQGTLKIINHSDIAINFVWKSFANLFDDNHERARLFTELSRMEKLEGDALLPKGCRENSFEDKATRAALSRKYENLRNALENDPMHFVDDIFEISPTEGTVWAQSEIEVTVTFCPDTAAIYSCYAYLDISGREDRIPLYLSGNGIGPNAVLSYDIYDIGDVFINSKQSYQVSIINKGDIPAVWSFLPTYSRLSNRFKFSPSMGYLDVGKSQVIDIQFCSDILGEFNERFHISLQGSEDPLVLTIKGQIVGPTFHFDCSEIEFGVVSFGILHSVNILLTNTSSISMDYKLVVPQDGVFSKKEFEISPNRGTLQPGEIETIVITFIPTTVKVYDYTLNIDVIGVGESILTIPLSAECIVSTVKLAQREISFGDVFVRHEYEKEMVFFNTSSVVETKISFLPQQQYSKNLANYTAIPSVVVIPAGGSEKVLIKFRSEKLGPFKIPVSIVVAGSQEPPIQAALSCNSIGPTVLIDKTDIKWGSIECLRDFSKSVAITNTSLILATVKIFMKLARSKFSLSTNEVTLAPQETYNLVITANVDDTGNHDDELYISVVEGTVLMIPVNARGIGTSIYCEQDISEIDFGLQLTNFTFEKRITLENKGRRQQELKWINQTNLEENWNRIGKSKKLTKEGKKVPKSLQPVTPLFSITPLEIILKPRTAVTFVFSGFCPVATLASETFILESRVGKERVKKPIISTVVKADVVDPLLHFSESELNFHYYWEKGVEAHIQKRSITLTNKSCIVLQFVLKAEVPFNLNSWEHSLNPEQSVDIIVDFDPLYKEDSTSHLVEKQLVVNYRGHPQKDVIPLRAKISFPNLEFNKEIINFGCILNDTQKSIRLKIKNWSELDASYSWIFLEESDTVSSTGAQSKVSTKTRSSHLPASQVFDVRPIRSVLKAGSTEDVEFIMFGYSNFKFSNSVICKVDGGPEYKLALSGEASHVSYSMDCSEINFQDVIFMDRKDEFLHISNNGKVPFIFSVNLDELSTPGVIEVIPSSGKIIPGEKCKVLVRFYPRLPTTFLEVCVFNIAHFDPVRFICQGRGIFSTVSLSLPRYKKIGPLGENGSVDDLWLAFQAEARMNILQSIQTKPFLEQDKIKDIYPHESSLLSPVYHFGHEYLQESTINLNESTLTTSRPKEPSHIALDTEMHRMAFCYHLKAALLNKASSGVSYEHTGIGKHAEKDSNISKIVIANYYCDFGNVIIGTNKKKIFKIMNNSQAGPLSWQFDKQILAGTGFSINPDTVSKLPEGGVIEVCVQFVARHKLAFGRQLVTLPITIKNSPTINIVLNANVCVPDILISSDTLEFDTVLLGCSKIMYLRMKNPSPVIARWSFQKLIGKDESKFQIIPSNGIIRPGDSIIVSVEFYPTDPKKIKVHIPLRIEMNTKAKYTLTLSGEGMGQLVRFDKQSIEIGPLFPYSEGEKKDFVIFNESEHDIEIYSLDFDDQYKHEENILQKINIFDDNGVYRSKVRLPGEPLPHFILEEYRRLSSEESIDHGYEAEILKFPPRAPQAPRYQDNNCQYVLLLGPAGSGLSTYCSILSDKFDLPVFSLDTVITDVSKTNCEAGLMARRILNTLTKRDNEYLNSRDTELKNAAEDSKARLTEQKKKDKKIKKDAVDEVLVTPESLVYDEYLEDRFVNSRNLSAIIVERLLWDDCFSGAIFDSLICTLASPALVLKTMIDSIPSLKIVQLQSKDGKEGYIRYIKSILTTKLEELRTLKRLVEESTLQETPKKSARGGKISRPVTASAVVTPTGDEPWIDPISGELIELSEHDFKALEDSQMSLYIAQLTRHRMNKIITNENIIGRFNLVLSIEDSDSKIENNFEKGGHDFCMSFDMFTSEIHPLVQHYGEENGLLYVVSFSEEDSVNDVISSLIQVVPGFVLSAKVSDAVPEPSVYQVYKKLNVRLDRKTITNFQLLTAGEVKYRWIIPAHGSVKVDVIYKANAKGRHDCNLGFEVLGTKQVYSVYIHGTCDLPQINTDARNIFMRRVKTINSIPPSKRYVVAEEFYSFGPMYTFKQSSWRTKTQIETKESTENYNLVLNNCDVLRITNSGRFKCIVDFGYLNEDESTFSVEPQRLELEENETKDVKIWAFPSESKQYSNTLLACIANNPFPTTFNVKCWGVSPTIEFYGPWVALIAAVEAEYVALISEAKPDVKLLKEKEQKLAELKESFVIDFERTLCSRIENCTFTVKNTSMLPISWEIDCSSTDSSIITVSPLSGNILVGGSATILVSFMSPVIAVVNSAFYFKYSDSEGGLLNKNRVISKKIVVKSESYSIQAVSLNASGEKNVNNEIDFGKFRVGDYVVQRLKLGNLGKYQISYKIVVKNPLTASNLAISPQEGVIDGGSSTDIELMLCSKDSEIVYNGNKDVKVQIIEPLTGEVVENFSLVIFGAAHFSKFRLQPAKGLSFGAMKYDSEIKCKKIEIRNEGLFELTYVICSHRSEVNEIDLLDGAAFSCLAYGTPPARRSSILGENYKSKLDNGINSQAKGGGKKDSKPTKNSKEPSPEVILKPLIKDPDYYPQFSAPIDPLKIGSFTIFPRVGYIQPGETVSIDVQFSPSGSKSYKEKARIIFSGSDDSSLNAQWAKNFELLAESCVPAIIVDDVYSIFEEQEIVNSLDDLHRDMSVEVGRVVYSKFEKVLAFGSVLCSQGSQKSGTAVRIKISNPTKITTVVNFKIYDRGIENSGQTDKKSKPKDDKKGKKTTVDTIPDSMPFIVQPEVWEIPPHEHRFVNIYFNPAEMKLYRYSFMAIVEDSPNSPSSLLFDLIGSGAMPCISIEQPIEQDSGGKLQLNFGKIYVGRSVSKSIIIKNNGVFPSTCLFDMVGCEDFLFPYNKTSLVVNPGEQHVLNVVFAPKSSNGIKEDLKQAQMKLSVVHNSFDRYIIDVKGLAYTCDAILESLDDFTFIEDIKFDHVNLSNGSAQVYKSFLLKSQSNNILRFNFSVSDDVTHFQFFPKVGHIAPFSSKEIKAIFSSQDPIQLLNCNVNCLLSAIIYETINNDEDLGIGSLWDDSMTVVRVPSEADFDKIKQFEDAYSSYIEKTAQDKQKGKKNKTIGPPPVCTLKLISNGSGEQLIEETVEEPKFSFNRDYVEQGIQFKCSACADFVKYSCSINGQQIYFKPTFMYQTSIHKFAFKNESNIDIPIRWVIDSLKRKGTSRLATPANNRAVSRSGVLKPIAPCPFFIEPSEYTVKSQSEANFTLHFAPLEIDEFTYSVIGELFSESSLPNEDRNHIKFIAIGEAKRPRCHFEIVESPEYMMRRPVNLKNEFGLYSPIESSDIKVVEVESIGLKCRNTFRFTVINPTNENCDFKWDAVGDPSPYWRCVLCAGILFSGKQTEMIFEYLPEDENIAETFTKFTLINGPDKFEQLFLFVGRVIEPRVSFNTSKFDFHAVLLLGEGAVETIFIENKEHIPFNFNFDKTTLQNLEGPKGAILEVSPKSGTVLPNSRLPIELKFKPTEEIIYNFNLTCEVKRKPKKLNINVKGEGYAVHPILNLESQGEHKYITLKPAPFLNYADMGAVQILDSVSKTLTVSNIGKFNFDYSWENSQDVLNAAGVSLSGGKLRGTLHKGEHCDYKITFSPAKGCTIDGTILTIVVAGKYIYNICLKGTGIQSAVKFSFIHFDFGSCFITSPGGSTVVAETSLKISNHDPVNNITIDCNFQKIRALWVDSHPTVLEPGQTLEIPIRFAPREVKSYSFAIPFIINGTSNISVIIDGNGIIPRLELLNAAQRRLNFGIIDVNKEVTKIVTLVNRSKKEMTIRLEESCEGALFDRCVTYSPKFDCIIPSNDKINVQVTFSPSRRISQFTEDIMVSYAGITRTLLNISGRAQGPSASLDTDSLSFGTVVFGSQKIKKLSLENTGDIPLSFSWAQVTLGNHFLILPNSGKISAGSEFIFDVIFAPKFLDPDIRQEGITLNILGLAPIVLTCSGASIAQPNDSIVTLTFDVPVRSTQTKLIQLKNPTEKEWFVAPTITGDHWSVPNEIKIPIKSSADVVVTYCPLLTCSKNEGNEKGHQGKLFIPLPDGTAQLYHLVGFASAPTLSGSVNVESIAKQPTTFSLKVTNWLSVSQKFVVNIEISEKPSPATFFVAANAIEVFSNCTKEFPVRFTSYLEGKTKAKVTFHNPLNGEYLFFEIHVATSPAQAVEELSLESPVRQSSRQLITIENPLNSHEPISMGNKGIGTDWWYCESKLIRLKEIIPLSGNPEGRYEIEFRPLFVSTSVDFCVLTIKTVELGNFMYKLKLKGLPSTVKHTLNFEVPLGIVQCEQFVFQTFNSAPTNYTIAIKHSSVYSCTKNLQLPAVTDWEGASTKIPVYFDPTNIGEMRDILTVSSPEGGHYECELIGKCVPSLPLGPYTITHGSSQDIAFRNCFDETCNFNFVVDSPAFRVSINTLTLQPKTEGMCTVSFISTENAVNEFIAAKLFIRCLTKPEMPPWIAYLRGKI